MDNAAKPEKAAAKPERAKESRPPENQKPADSTPTSAVARIFASKWLVTLLAASLVGHAVAFACLRLFGGS
ncbi:MAG: hypothetical protein ACYTG0_36775, partial [Planctomycetota bacterium]